MSRSVDVAIVGGGPAGATVATLLAHSGHEVVLLERAPAWRWRPGGVFASPAVPEALLRIGLAREEVLRVARPIPAMRLETARGSHVRLTYGADEAGRPPAVGLDRSRLDPALLALASEAGVDVHSGATVTSAELDSRRPWLDYRDDGAASRLHARFVVGADGIRSTVARHAAVARPSRMGHRVGLTFHAADPRPAAERPDARMVVLERAYCGLAPVPGGRVNVGIVLAGRGWAAALAAEGAAAVARRILERLPAAADDPVAWADAPRSDAIVGAAPVGHRVARRAGERWLLVGDAAGFLDPFTGEGLHRALVSAELAAAAVDARLRGRARSFGPYERGMRRRFATKDLVSLITLALLERPIAFEYVARRLARRGEARETMGLVMGDLVPASRALDPRFLATLLSP